MEDDKMVERQESVKINSSLLESNSRVTLPLLVQKKEIRINSNSKERLEIIGSDAAGTIVINFWDDVRRMNNQIREGHLYNFSGVTNEYNGKLNLKGQYAGEILGNKAEFIPRYIITPDDFNMFDAIYSHLPTSNQKLISYLTGYKSDVALWNKFITTPLSERYAYNKIGGLFMHTLEVTKLINRIIKGYTPNKDIDIKRLITKSLLHDIAKMELFIISAETFSIKKIETNIDDNIISSMNIMNANKKLNLFSKEEIDNIAYGVISHKGEFSSIDIKNLEDSILYHANLIDMGIHKK